MTSMRRVGRRKWSRGSQWGKKFNGLNEDKKKKKIRKEMFFRFENPVVTRE